MPRTGNVNITARSQEGAVLAVCLIILLVLTLMVVSGNRTVLMQEKMTSAVRDAHIALEDAEMGLRAGEVVIENLAGTSGFSDTGTGGFYSVDNGPVDVFAAANWASGKYMTADESMSDNPAHFFIEELGVISVESEDLSGINMLGYGQTTGGGDVTAFRVVSRGVGQSGNAERILVAFYGKRL